MLAGKLDNIQMCGVPADIAKNYSILLRNKGIPSRNHYHFQKWLRYYVVFVSEVPVHFGGQRQLAPLRAETAREEPERVSAEASFPCHRAIL